MASWNLPDEPTAVEVGEFPELGELANEGGEDTDMSKLGVSLSQKRNY